jgi:two-component system chemotaxis response regulator CheB
MEMKLDAEDIKRSIEATCPDCRGPLSVTGYEGLQEYSCLVGHLYSARGLLQTHSETQEKSLWSAVVALEEAGNLVREVAGEFPDHITARLQEQADKKKEQATVIRRVLQELEAFETGI